MQQQNVLNFSSATYVYKQLHNISIKLLTDRLTNIATYRAAITAENKPSLTWFVFLSYFTVCSFIA